MGASDRPERTHGLRAPLQNGRRCTLWSSIRPTALIQRSCRTKLSRRLRS